MGTATSVEQDGRERWEDRYRIGPEIGSGSFGTVHEGFEVETDEAVAIKKISCRNLVSDVKHPTGSDTDPIARAIRHTLKTGHVGKEAEIVQLLKNADHPNIVPIRDVYIEEKFVLIVMDLMKGGELFDALSIVQNLSEARAAHILRDVVRGVAYLHKRGIVHRDLKPENILVQSKTDLELNMDIHVRIADFGLSAFVSDCDEDQRLVGSFNYIAPEMARMDKYGTPVDMWACGVLLYVMIAGRPPFAGSSDKEKLQRAREADYSFPDEQWANVSDCAKSLVLSLLQEDPNKRLTAQAALEHPFLAECEQQNTAKLKNDLSGLAKFRRSVAVVVAINKIRKISSVEEISN